MSATSKLSVPIWQRATASPRCRISFSRKDISVGAKLAYAMLLKYAWDDDACFPGQVKLAKDMGAADAASGVPRRLEKAALEIVQRGLARPICTGSISPLRSKQPWPALTGKICRSRPATLADQRQIRPLSLYKNTHLRILILKIPSREMHFSKGKRHSKCTYKGDPFGSSAREADPSCGLSNSSRPIVLAECLEGYNWGTPDLYPFFPQ